MTIVRTVTALLLDLSNIVGGLLLAGLLLQEIPRVGPALGRLTGVLARAGVVIGIVALAVGGYYLIVHVTSGPHVFHFELVGIGVGVALLRDRLFPRSAAVRAPATAPLSTAGPGGTTGGPGGGPGGAYPDTRLPPQPGPATTPVTSPVISPLTGASLLLAVFGLIAIVVGIQGLFTPDG